MRVYVLYEMHMTDTAAGGYAHNKYPHIYPFGNIKICQHKIRNYQLNSLRKKEDHRKKKSKDTSPIFRNEVKTWITVLLM